MVGVNVNGYDFQKLKQVIAKAKLIWRSFADDGSIVGTWNLPGTPTFYVLDPRGVIRYKWMGSPGAKAIDAALDKLLKEAEGNGK